MEKCTSFNYDKQAKKVSARAIPPLVNSRVNTSLKDTIRTEAPSGNVSQHSYLSFGVVFGLGYHRQY